MKSASQPVQSKSLTVYTLIFGLFLGLCIWKFGEPVILDHKISPPETASDFFNDAWPPHWASFILPPLVFLGVLLALRGRLPAFPSKWLWILPLVWIGWQCVSLSQTPYPDLAVPSVWQYGGCVACYFLGAWLFARPKLFQWLLIGLLLAFTYCLVRAANQRLFEFPVDYQQLVAGEQCGWTNFPPPSVDEMKSQGIIINTNGMDMANPIILAKFQKGRVSGTLVYPNALAELILLLWPVSLVLAFGATTQLKPFIRWAAIVMTVGLGGIVFIWTGSKLGWLIAVALAGLILLRPAWPKKLKFAAVALVLVLGLGVFGIRFHHYFATGATSASARFDYWRAAVQITGARPAFGTGPGTFQRSYAMIKSPDAEMARLTHNDFLEQFCDSGIVGGVAYAGWVVMALAFVGRRLWRSHDGFSFAVFLGILGWYIQGLGEFGLFVPALAWTAFTLLGGLVGKNPPE